MRQEGGLWKIKEPRVDFGLVGEDVQSDSTEMTIFQSSNHCLFVNDFSSRSVDDNCPWFQGPNPFLADETNGFLPQRYMYTQNGFCGESGKRYASGMRVQGQQDAFRFLLDQGFQVFYQSGRVSAF